MNTLRTLQAVDHPCAGAAVHDGVGARARLEAVTAGKPLPRSGIDSQIELLAFVAHEMRSPLAPIRTAAALLTRVGPADLARAQAIIERQVEHLARMIDDLLDLARGETGRLALVRSDVHLVDVIDQALVACLPALTVRQQHVERCGDVHGVDLHADGARLVQIVTNLVDNASKFSGDGATVTVTARRRTGVVELAVADQGMGMDAATLSRAFEPFAQGSHAPGLNRSGLGIGLAVVRQLAESHGGHVVAESAGPGCGSRFVLTLPCIAP